MSEIGRTLIPRYQRNMADSDSSKIPFRFFVVIEKEPNAFALPNGVVVVNSGLFNVLQNEAQFESDEKETCLSPNGDRHDDLVSRI